MPFSITSQFEDEGFVGRLDVLDASETRTLRDNFNQLEKEADVLDASESRTLRGNFNQLEKEAGKIASQYSFHNVHMKYPWVFRAATHKNIINPIKEILGPNLILLDSRFICKYPDSEIHTNDGEKAFVAWHQDIRYWGIDGTVVTAWLALDDADTENGCMQVIPGTHKQGIVEHETYTKGGNLLSANQSIPLNHVDISSSVPCPVKAGQMSLHHGLLIHGSEPNTSTRRRCGYVIRFVSTSAKPIEDPDRPRSFPCTVVVSGTDTFKHFKDNTPEFSC